MDYMRYELGSHKGSAQSYRRVRLICACRKRRRLVIATSRARRPSWFQGQLINGGAIALSPDLISDNVAFQSHSEKVVLIDNIHARIGGMDMCSGRWDGNSHLLADVKITDVWRSPPHP
ncbi:hypothetical protein FA95DRAFT_1284829 [Auriscalpium vulgare]|uniref:Uncharacterized protein n=1 Tax=Auriscalpium vulgare TaxID=40419 RepID=A0ACB8RSZ1_9AGAM|nr:hypothetical protein FA95DRAFT_1284829 [Auriscalpium vulgare]